MLTVVAMVHTRRIEKIRMTIEKGGFLRDCRNMEVSPHNRAYLWIKYVFPLKYVFYVLF